jgi:hypothetical protein
MLQYNITYCKRKIYLCHQAVSGYGINELPTVNTSIEHKLFSTSQTIFILVYRVYSVIVCNILCDYMKCSILQKETVYD